MQKNYPELTLTKLDKMKSLSDQFTLKVAVFQGLAQPEESARTTQQVTRFFFGQNTIDRMSDGVPVCLASSIKEAQQFQNGTAGDVLANLKWQRGQLDILISNLEKLDGDAVPEDETAYEKALRTGIKPDIWSPIFMTKEELEHFRTHSITWKKA